MTTRNSYLSVEAPATRATVDFLSEGVAVEVTVEHGKLFIRAKIGREESSEWIQHDFEVLVPAKDDRP